MVFVLLLIVVMLLSLSSVQTAIALRFSNYLQEQYGIDVSLQKAKLDFLGDINLKDFIIRDRHHDTLIYTKNLKVNLGHIEDLWNGQANLDKLTFNDLSLNIKTYKGELDSNLKVLLKSFPNDNNDSNRVRFKARDLKINNAKFKIQNYNDATSKSLDIRADVVEIDTLIGIDSLWTVNLSNAKAHMPYGDVRSFSGTVKILPNHLNVNNFNLQTPKSDFKGNIKCTLPFDENTEITADIKNSKLQLSEVPFLELPDRSVKFDVRAKGNIRDINISKLKVATGDSRINLFDIEIEAFSSNFKKWKISAKTRNSDLKIRDVKKISREFGWEFSEDILSLGDIDFSGEVITDGDHAKLFITADSYRGSVNLKINVSNFREPKKSHCEGQLKISKIYWDLSNDLDMSKTTFKSDFYFNGFYPKSMNAKLYGQLKNIRYKDHTYELIILSGLIIDGQLITNISIHDEILNVDVKTIFNPFQKEKTLKLKLDAKRVVLDKISDLFDEPSIIKGKSSLNLIIRNSKNFWGVLNFSDVKYTVRDSVYSFDNTDAHLNITDSFKILEVSSKDLISGYVKGNFRFKDLMSMTKNAVGRTYENYKTDDIKGEQNVGFDIEFHDKLFKAFYPKISVSEDTHLYGKLYSKDSGIYTNLSASEVYAYGVRIKKPKIEIDNQKYSDIFVKAESVEFKHYQLKNIRLFNEFKRDTLFFKTTFDGENDDEHYEINNYFTIDRVNNYVFGFKPSLLNIKGNSWYLGDEGRRKNKIVWNKYLNRFSIENLTLKREYRKIVVDAHAEKDNLKAKLSLVNIDLNDLIPNNSAPHISGFLNGDFSYKHDKNQYEIFADAHIKKLEFNNFKLGDLSIDARSESSKGKIILDAVLKNENNTPFKLSGSVYRAKDIQNNTTHNALDMSIGLDAFDYGFLDPDNDIVSKLRGKATGVLKIGGILENPSIKGVLEFDDAGIKIPYINVDYIARQHSKIYFYDHSINANNIVLSDTKYYKPLYLNGSVSYMGLHDRIYDLSVDSGSSISTVMDTSEDDNDYFYGLCFAKGKATLKGQEDELSLDISINTEKGTEVTIPIKDQMEDISNDYIRVKQKPGRTGNRDKLTETITEEMENEMNIDVEVSFTPDTELNILTKGASKLNLNSYGSGKLNIETNLKGSLQLFGSYLVNHGSYEFDYLSVITRKFELQKGGLISWDGNLSEGLIQGVSGVYKLQSNPDILTGDVKFGRAVNTDVTVDIHGKLYAPETDFYISFPDTPAYLKSDIEFYLNDEQEREIQAMSLIMTGSFRSRSYNDFRNGIHGGTSSLINSFFRDKNSLVNLGLSYETQHTNPGSYLNRYQHNRIGINVTTNFSDKVTFNGKLGVPVTGYGAKSIAAEGEIVLPISGDNSLVVKIFNKRSEIQDLLSLQQNYTRGLGIYYNMSFDTFSEVIDKILGDKNKKSLK